MSFKLRCPDCRDTFPWDPKKAFPRFCPCCSSDINNDRADDDIPMPFISKAANRSVDAVYRAMEKSSEVRAEQAAQMAGVPVADMAGLKVTNLRDGQRAGDVAAMPVRNPVTQFMEQHKVNPWRQGAGIEHSPAVQTGVYPNSGAKFMPVLREIHGQREGYDKVGDRPANEVFQPGYRRRG